MKIKKIIRNIRPFYDLTEKELTIAVEFLELYRDGKIVSTPGSFNYDGRVCLDFATWAEANQKQTKYDIISKMIRHDSRWFLLSEPFYPFGQVRGIANEKRKRWIVETLDEIKTHQEKVHNPYFSHF